MSGTVEEFKTVVIATDCDGDEWCLGSDDSYETFREELTGKSGTSIIVNGGFLPPIVDVRRAVRDGEGWQ